jgi:hypothetical protein
MGIIARIVQVGPVGGYRPLGDADGRNGGIDLPPPPEVACALTLTIELAGSKPRIWRRLRIRGDLTLDQVHNLLQAGMGWTDSHLHRFQPGAERGYRQPYFVTELDEEEGDEGTREDSVRLDQVLRAPGDMLTYIYDFGDNWKHLVRLESLAPLTRENREPRCLGGARACPPEDVGGISGHNELAAWLRAGAPAGEVPEPFDSVEHAMNWLPAGYDPDYFSAADCTTEMAAWGRGEPLPWHGLPEPLAGMVSELRGPGRATAIAWLAALDSRGPQPLEEADLARASRPWLALFDVVGTGTRLTAAGNLPPAAVAKIAQAAGVTDWWIGKANREDLTWPVAALREAGQAMGLLRKAKGTLTTTTRARNVSRRPDELVAAVLRRLPLGHGFDSEAGWFVLLGAAAGVSGPELHTGLAQILASRGWGSPGRPTISVSEARGGSRLTLAVLRLMSPGVGATDDDLLTRLARARLFGF